MELPDQSTRGLKTLGRCFENGFTTLTLTSQAVLWTMVYQLYRGVRQGLPFSALLFVLAIAVLPQAIRENENIRGLKISDTELKLSMYVNECSASHLFNLLNDFGTCPGLKTNISETEGMWLGSLKMPLRRTRSIPHGMARRICIYARCRLRLWIHLKWQRQFRRDVWDAKGRFKSMED